MPSHNKGKKYKFCPECKRKRYCSRIYLNVDWLEWICSQKHKWKTKIAHLEKIISVELERLAPQLRDTFNRDDLFYASIRRR
jgi:hypothetical protein